MPKPPPRDPAAADGLPMQVRAAPITSVNAAARTIDLVWTTGAKVRRYDWWEGEPYDEELVVSGNAVDLARLKDGAPLLDQHRAWDLEGVIGVVEKASVSGGEGRATVRFAKAEDHEGADRIFRMIQDGIIRNVSVGYTVNKVERIIEPGKVTLWRVVDWQPYELSIVAVGADPGAGVRSEGARTFPVTFTNEARSMSDHTTDPQNGAANPSAAPEAVPPAAPATPPAPQPETRTVPTAAVSWTPADMAKVQARAGAFGLTAADAIAVMGETRSVEEATDALQSRATEKQASRTNPHHRAGDAPKPEVAARAARLDPAAIYGKRRAAATGA